MSSADVTFDLEFVPLTVSYDAVEPKKTTEIQDHILQLLTSGDLIRDRKQMVGDFTQITPDQLKDVLSAYFEEATAKTEGKDPFKVVEELAEMIPFEKLEETVFTDKKSALIKAKSMLYQAKYHLKNSETKVSPSLKAKLSDIVDHIISFIESILSAFGVADFFKPASTQIQRQFKFQKITMLVSFFSMLTTMLFPLLGVTIAAPIIGGSLLLIAVMSVIYPHIAPVPFHLPGNAKNWTKECNQGEWKELSFIKVDRDVLDEMANTMINSQKGGIKKHPLLRGESRVGKTQTAKAFVQAIERGDYPELKGKKVFYLNTTKLCKKGDFFEGTDPLEQLSEAMGRHKDKIILVFDEIHVACQGEKNSVIGQKLLDMLDNGGDFPYVIGITNEYSVIEQYRGFRNRFNPIIIENTDSKDTREILTRYLLTTGKSALCEKDTLEKIYEKTKGKAQPYTSRAVLDKCIELTSEKQNPLTAKKIQKKQNIKEFLASNGVVAPIDFDDKNDVTSTIEELDKRIGELQEELVAEEAQFRNLFKAKDKISQARDEIYRTVMKVANVQTSSLSSKDEVQLNTFMLMSRFLAPTLEAYVRKKGGELGVKVVIDEDVINDAVRASEEKAPKEETEG
ncbi:MAG: Chaperone protein ClpB [Chlamydiae bacterium]|nr:Chaperone protein ClpB [Chlamydiota bacterium]